MMNAQDRNTAQFAQTGKNLIAEARGDHERRFSAAVLSRGAQLNALEILEPIAEGPAGISYHAYDHSLQKRVVLKEYFPAGIAARNAELQVGLHLQSQADAFDAGLKGFMAEARILANTVSPFLAKVRHAWEANGTAYMVMPFYEAVTLRQAFEEYLVIPTQEWIRALLADLISANAALGHMPGFSLHFAPEDILLLKDGRPLLLGFSAARQALGRLAAGFAPIEQYPAHADIERGEWTDVYALAANVYYLIAATPPVSASERMTVDTLVPARDAGKDRYSTAFLVAVDRALAVWPEQRIRSLAEFREAMQIPLASPRELPEALPAASHDAPATVISPLVTATPIPAVRPEPPSRFAPQVEALKPEKSEQKPVARPDILQARTLLDIGTPKAQPRPAPAGKQQRIEPVLGPTLTPRDELHAAPQIKPETTNTLTGITAAAPHPVSIRAATPVREMSTDKRFTATGKKRARPALAALAVVLATGVAAGVYLGAKSFSGTSEGTGATVVLGKPTDTFAGTADDRPVHDDRIGKQAGLTPRASAIEKMVKESVSESSGSETGKTTRDQGKANGTAERARGNATLQAKAPGTSAAPEAQVAPTVAVVPDAAAPAISIPAAPGAPATPPFATPGSSSGSGDETAWRTATAIDKAAAYENYLLRYPGGRHTALARDKLATARLAEQGLGSLGAASSGYAPPSMAAGGASSAPATSGPDPATVIAPSVASAARTPEANAAPGAPVIDLSTSRQAATRFEPAPATTQVPSRAQPMSGAPSSTRPIRVEGQTMTGNFTVDERTGLISGTGRIVWNNGNRFEGTLVRGVKQGKGEFVWANGLRYSGDWANDMPNGNGAMLFPNGNRYEGEIRDGKPNGRGTLQFANGNRYDGEIVEGLPEGQGIHRFKSGDVYSGTWSKGKIQGMGRYTWASGNSWEGEFRDDKRTANGNMVFSDRSGPVQAAAGAR